MSPTGQTNIYVYGINVEVESETSLSEDYIERALADVIETDFATRATVTATYLGEAVGS